MIALIDGDIVVFRAGFASEKSTYTVYGMDEKQVGVYQYKKEIPKEYLNPSFFVDKTTIIEPLEYCLHAVKELLISIMADVGATSHKIFLSGKKNFRHDVAVTRPYKGNRDAAHRPKYEHDIREYLVKHWEAEIVEGIEADDRLVTEQMKDYSKFEYEKKCGDNYTSAFVSTIICSVDKDLNQCPGWHYNFVKKEKYWIEEFDATKYFYTQLLTGDVTDNIQGVVGIGPKTAEKLLAPCNTEREMYNVAREKYRDLYGGWAADDVLMEMATLLYIQKKENDKWLIPSI